MNTGCIPSEDKGRGQHGVSSSQGVPVIVSRPPEIRREAWTRFYIAALRRNEPYQHLDLRLLPSTTVIQ